MPKVRSVVVLSFAALVTAGTAAVGLNRAVQFWDELVAPAACAVPPPAAVTPAAVTPAAPVTCKAPESDSRISILSVRSDAVEIEAGGRRHELPGYPPPSTTDHSPPRLTTAVVAPDGRLVALAGDCYGQSGTGLGDGIPSCAPVFVRVYRATDGGHVRDLKMAWDQDDDVREPLAIAFDERAERLAIVVRSTWSDCMWEGDTVELFVYRLADGARLAKQRLADDEPDLRRSLTFVDDAVRVTTVPAHGHPKVRVVRLRKPSAAQGTRTEAMRVAGVELPALR